MSRIILFVMVLLTACNNNSGSSSGAADSTNSDKSGTQKGYTWTKEDENEFLNDCVAQTGRAEDTAFIKCKCVLNQLEQNFPSLDSFETYFKIDSVKATEYAKNCK